MSLNQLNTVDARDPLSSSEPQGTHTVPEGPVFGRVTGQDVADLLQELQLGTRSCLSVSEGLELLKEVRFLRQQMQRIRVVSDSKRVQTLAHDALYGDRLDIEIRIVTPSIDA
jgi:hypothetical protein